MMKRTARAIDVPKLRRNLKNRGRITETMCYGYLSGFAYVKLLLLWLVCIALDLIFGFRFELLYPVWLLIRNCYDSFRFQGLVSSFQYSAFSAFFVCATVTTDLICFLLLPVEVLLFLASTYVWLQFVLHTAERGVGCTQLLLWVVLILFEYNWRYRGDSPLYLLSGSTLGYAFEFLNEGLLSSWLGLRDGPPTNTVSGSASSARTECPSSKTSSTPSAGGMLGGFGIALTTAFAHSSSFGSELCRPFAAHCIGYPLVMLGFGLKAYLSLWRVRRRQREVSRENEVYCRLLTEALPSIYEGPKAYARCNGSSMQEPDTSIDYDTELSLSNLAICASPSPGVVLPARKTSRAGTAWKQHNGWKGAAGLGVGKRGAQTNGTVLSPRKHHITSSVNDDDDSASSASLSSAPRLTLWRMARDVLLGVFGFLIGGGGLGETGSSLDDRASVSSNEVESEDEMLEQEDNSSQADDFPLAAQGRSSAQRTNPKKTKGAARIKGGGRARGRNVQPHSDYLLPSVASGTPLSASCTLNNNILNLASGSNQHDKLYSPSLTSASGFQNGGVVSNDVYASSSTPINGKIDAVMLEELENLRGELRASRGQESDLRCLLQQSMNSEKVAKGELAQLKAKHEQTDAKLSNLLKAREQDKSSMQLLEKRLIEAQSKKNELEKELSAEKRSKLKEEHAAARALAAAQSAKIIDCGEACKAKKADLEREIRATRRDLKAKEELTCVYEEQLRQLREFKESNEIQELQSNLQSLQEKNHHLEQSLSAENRLKQDLFRVLNETRNQTETLKQQLRSKDIELMELRSQLSKDMGDGCKLSPTGNARATLGGLTSAGAVRLPSSVGMRLPSVNGCSSSTNSLKMTSVNNEQNMELLTAALSSAANNAYLPYSFNAHPGAGELLFDATVSNNVPGVNAPSSNSVSPPPAGSSPGIGAVGSTTSDPVCFNKFGVPSVPTTTSVRST